MGPRFRGTTAVAWRYSSRFRTGARRRTTGGRAGGAQLLGRSHIHGESFRIDHDAIELRRGLDRDIALADVLAHLVDRPLERIAIAAAAARSDLERVARLELRHQDLGVGKIGLPLAPDAQLDRVARALEAAIETPGTAMRAVALVVDHHIGARAHHALDAQAAAAAAGAAGIRHQPLAVYHDRKLELGLLVRAVVGVAVVDADGAGDAVLVALGAPAAAQRPEAADEELRRPV